MSRSLKSLMLCSSLFAGLFVATHFNQLEAASGRWSAYDTQQAQGQGAWGGNGGWWGDQRSNWYDGDYGTRNDNYVNHDWHNDGMHNDHYMTHDWNGDGIPDGQYGSYYQGAYSNPSYSGGYGYSNNYHYDNQYPQGQPYYDNYYDNRSGINAGVGVGGVGAGIHIGR